MDENINNNNNNVRLDDVTRVKVQSPGQLVMTRFLRNKLAIFGLVILVFMFLFSFVGGLLTPYGESQVFQTYDTMNKDYAGAALCRDYRYQEAEGRNFSLVARSAWLGALGSGEDMFSSGGMSYVYSQKAEDFYLIYEVVPVTTVNEVKGAMIYSAENDAVMSAQMKSLFETAVSAGENDFLCDGTEYFIYRDGRSYGIGVAEPAAFAGKLEVVAEDASASLSFDFKYQAALSYLSGGTQFAADGAQYTLTGDPEFCMIYEGQTSRASVSKYIIQAVESGTFLSAAFKTAALDAISDDYNKFEYDGVEYSLERKDFQWTIKKNTVTLLIDRYASPSREHLMGTDGNGMDVLTRLMYGGRISLSIGFAAILIEVLLGVILGGISGYFGKWVDNLIMRIVDIFNCIPQWPILIILGTIMDAYRVDPRQRIYVMMFVIGFLGWPYIARIVRGQILSLREQEFMIAAEATGLSIKRRIFMHLVPNVIPQLIVYATMGLGDIIIMESTMSFLGLGVKFPYASWGNIIQAVSDSYVMNNFWFLWIPAGFCILITVLGFNFVGDGLRDAFDPKMKR